MGQNDALRSSYASLDDRNVACWTVNCAERALFAEVLAIGAPKTGFSPRFGMDFYGEAFLARSIQWIANGSEKREMVESGL